MCVIIAREPSIIIPPEKIESACHVNPDGFGFSVIDRGKMETIREVDAKGNNPTRIMKLLEDAKDQTVFLHLRYQTAGLKNLDNAHPFQLTNLKDDGIEVQFMHNGHLHDFASGTASQESDTAKFAKALAAPLVSRLAAASQGLENLLDDSLFEMIMQKYCGTSSKFLFYDNNGKFLIINRKAGQENKGWWASNDYSFNRTHREPTKSTFDWDSRDYSNGIYGRGGNYSGSNAWKGNGATSTDTVGTTPGVKVEAVVKQQGSSVVPFQYDKTKATEGSSADASAKVDAKILELDGKDAGETITVYKSLATSAGAQYVPPEQRDTFVELTDIDCLKDVCHLDQDTIRELVDAMPELATILIMDLIYELYMKSTGAAE